MIAQPALSTTRFESQSAGSLEVGDRRNHVAAHDLDRANLVLPNDPAEDILYTHLRQTMELRDQFAGPRPVLPDIEEERARPLNRVKVPTLRLAMSPQHVQLVRYL